MREKVIGYSLVSIGLIIMIFCVINMVMVFSDNAKPFSIFNISSSNSALNIGDIVSQLQKSNPSNLSQSIPAPKIDILPPEVINQTLNLSTHFFLMTFILGFGYKLSSLGVQFVRPINVKLKSSPETPLPNPPSSPPPPTIH